MPLSNVNIYDTNVLVQLVPNLKVSQNFLLDRFFPNIVTSDTEYVSIDVDLGKRRMAPFVSPLHEGKLVEARRYQTNTFKPAYIKDKRAPDLRKPVRRMMGERIGGELSAAEREMAKLQFELTDQIDMINRRLEWMAAQALLTGTITVAGDGFPTTLIDYGRDASLTVALGAGVKWTAANIASGAAVPSDDVSTWAQSILKASGTVVTDIVFTTTAFNAFKRDPVVKAAIWFPGNGNAAGSANAINVATGIVRGAQYQGRWGAYDLWVYNDWYVDASGVEQPMMPAGSLVMAGPDMSGTRSFGAIMDPEFAYGAMAYAPKSWVNKDPAQRYLMTQSSPLVIPSRANGALAATVL